jgi:hypothetical protein
MANENYYMKIDENTIFLNSKNEQFNVTLYTKIHEI